MSQTDKNIFNRLKRKIGYTNRGIETINFKNFWVKYSKTKELTLKNLNNIELNVIIYQKILNSIVVDWASKISKYTTVIFY